jgi:uncharacterized protein with GYD domain
MPKFLVHFSYTNKGLEGLYKEGGSARREAARQLIESLGGRLEAYYFAFGEHDGIAIADMPDNTAMTAAAGAVGLSGAVTVQTTVLVTPEEVDEAVKRSSAYRPPGQ